MSHRIFSGSILSNPRVWELLKRIDAAEAERSRSAGCPHCGGALHSATYPRKPHGLSPALRTDARRHSLCCATCRRRVLPPSVRFFGRRFRVAPLFLAVSALLLAGGARLEAIGRQWGIPVLTLRRWRRWWQEAFVQTLDIAVIDVPVLRLDHRNDRQRLEETVERIRPHLVVLDPLVRLHGVDENAVADIAPILGFLRDLQRRFEAAVLLVHHSRKSGATRPGQALRGTDRRHRVRHGRTGRSGGTQAPGKGPGPRRGVPRSGAQAAE